MPGYRWLASIWLALALAQAPGQQGAADRDLQAGVPVEGDLGPEEQHFYRVSMAAAQYFHLTLSPAGPEMAATLMAPDGAPVAELDTGAEAARTQFLVAIAPTTGTYRVKVELADSRSKPGRYRAVLEPLRPATDRDRLRVAAERALVEGQALHGKNTRKSWQAAIEKYRTALEAFQSLGESGREYRALLVLGVAHESLEEKAVALEYFRRLLPLAERGDLAVQAQALNRMGRLHLDLFENQKALEYMERSLALTRQRHDFLGEAAVLTNMAQVYGRLGENRKALEQTERTIPLFRASGDIHEEASGRNALGRRYFVVGEYAKALEQFRQSLELRKVAKEGAAEGSTLSNIADVYGAIGEHQRALDYRQQSLALRKKIGDIRGVAVQLNNMGSTYRALGQFDKAMELYQKALLIYREELRNRLGEASTVSNIGSVYLDGPARDLPKAIDHFRQAIALWQSVEDRNGEAISTLNLGKSYAQAGERELALRHCTRALEMARSQGARSLLPAVLRQLAALARSGGDLAAASGHAEEALAVVEEVRAGIADPAQRASWLALVQGIYEFQVEVLMARGETAGALEWAERARSRSLLDTLAAAGLEIHQGVDPALLDREQGLRRQVETRSASHRKLLSSAHTPQQETAAARALETALGEHQEAVAAIRAASPGYAALAQPQPLRLKDIQEALDSDTVLLEYALGEERSFLWVATPEGVAPFELARRSEIERAARRFQELLSARNRGVEGETSQQQRARLARAEAELPQAAADLSRMLLRPAAAHLSRRRLAVVASDALQYVPFAALPAPGSRDSRPLVADHEVVHLPSASTLAVLRRQFAGRRQAAGQLAVLADPVFDPEDSRVSGVPRAARSTAKRSSDEPPVEGWQRSARAAGVSGSALWLPRLLLSREEARAIAALAPPQARLLALDFEANRALAVSDRLAGYRIVHFATHGFFHSQHPDLSGLVLSLVDERGRPRDGFLRLHEISALKLPVELVVLSACQTALGREVRGEGLVGLARAFMHAGAARVVASLWMVDDAATSELMKRFYQAMLGPRKLSASAALREAQAGLWRQARWRSPYYWAGFQLQGEWR